MSTIRQKIYGLLRWSEKWTKTDMVYLASGSFWLTAGNVICAAGSFVLAVAFANLISPETYGIYKYVLATFGILSISTLPGMANSFIRSVARGSEGSFYDALRAKIKWGLLGGLASLIIAIYYYLNNNPALFYSFLVAAVFIPFLDSIQIYQPLLSGKKLFKLSAAYTSMGQIFAIAAMIATLFLTKNIYIIIITYLASNMLVRYVFFQKTLWKIKLNDKKDPETIPFGKHLTAMSIIGLVAGQLDKILLWHFIGGAQLAIYAFALAPVDQIKNSLRNIAIVAYPKLAEKNKEEIKKTLPLKMIKFFFVLALGVAAYIALTPLFYKIFFPQYLESIKYSRLYALTLLFFPQRLMGTTLNAHKQTKALYILQTTSPFVSIAIMASLIPLYGIYGAITAAIIPLIINTFMLSYFFKKI